MIIFYAGGNAVKGGEGEGRERKERRSCSLCKAALRPSSARGALVGAWIGPPQGQAGFSPQQISAGYVALG